jgi:hypothetical protein
MVPFMTGKRQGANHKTNKQKSSYSKPRVLNVKPKSIPDLEGKDAVAFEKQIGRPPTAKHRKILQAGSLVFAQVKKKQ